MFSSILAFVLGTGGRMVWGELSSWFTAAREHKREIERMRLQGELEDKAHARNLESMRVCKELELNTVRVQGEMDIGKLETQGWADSVREGMKPTGIWIIDLWNGVIRPAAASLALFLWINHLHVAQWAMADRDWEMVCAILGWFFADRTMGKKGK